MGHRGGIVEHRAAMLEHQHSRSSEQQHQAANRPAKPRSKNRERRERAAKLEMSESETDSSSDDYHHHRHAAKRPPTAGKRPRRRRAGNAPAPSSGGAPGGAGVAPAGAVTPTGRSSAIPVATPQLPPGALKSSGAGATAQTSGAGASLTTSSVNSSKSEIGSVRAAVEELEKGGGLPGLSPQGEADKTEVCSNSAISSQEQTDKQKQRKLEKEEKLRLKEQAKQDKRDRDREKKEEKERAKEEKRKEKAEKKVAARQGIKANSVQGAVCIEDFRASDTNPVPVFLSKTIQYIEAQGLDAEGLYRVPGNRAHVDLIFKQYDENKNFELDDLDIAVNAVATAVKDFFFKRLPPLLSIEHMDDLESVSTIQDRSQKLSEIKKLIDRLPKTNFAILKFIFTHFVRVSERSKENCMDSKNLAICWWPTLLQYEFGDLNKFETMRPHLEDVVQILIDQYRFIFCGQEEGKIV